jgi:ribosomal-protein-alanine N-acetyltransferase
MTVALSGMRWWDIEAAHELEGTLFPDAWSVEQFWQEMAQPSRHYVVAREGGDLIAYGGAFVMPPDSDVQTIAVRADCQGRGIASMLLTEMMSKARTDGATHMLLEVRTDNAPALALYERIGFMRISQRPRYYPDGGDALILRASLAAGNGQLP